VFPNPEMVSISEYGNVSDFRSLIVFPILEISWTGMLQRHWQNIGLFITGKSY
jgi:hypothetical protein